MSLAKNDWYTKKIDENKDNPQKLWKSINQVLHRKEASPLPDCSDQNVLEMNSVTFSKIKKNNIRAAFQLDVNTGEPPTPPSPFPPKLQTFRSVTEDEVRKLIMSPPNKQCMLDPCPTFIIKACIDQLVLPITNIINYSLSERVFPEKPTSITEDLGESSCKTN